MRASLVVIATAIVLWTPRVGKIEICHLTLSTEALKSKAMQFSAIFLCL